MAHLPEDLKGTFTLLENAARSKRYVRKEQRPDGSWRYYY